MDDKVLEKWADALDRSGKFRVLRKVPELLLTRRMPKNEERIGIILDTETTGLNQKEDEVIELSMIKFSYDKNGNIIDTIDAYSSLQRPRRRLSEEIIKLTGITNEMLKNEKFNLLEIEDFVLPASLIVAHNAAFDRPMCERISHLFKAKPWACSATEIPWREYGFDGARLSYLVSQFGLFYDGHRASNDAQALLNILTRTLPGRRDSAYSVLLRHARKTRCRIWAKATYGAKEKLKDRGYRWNPGGNGRPRSWWIEVDEDLSDREITFLTRRLNLSAQEVKVERVTAYQRFRPYDSYLSGTPTSENEENRVPQCGSDNDKY